MSPVETAIIIEPYRPDHAAAWRSLNEDWLLAGGYVLEAKDQLVLGDPQGAILEQGRLHLHRRAGRDAGRVAAR
jgi:putative acetyltransferase